jgi:type IV pilus assembly protein PilC
MARFTFTAKTASGELIKETLDADSEGILLSTIKERNLFLISMKEIGEGGVFSGSIGSNKLSLKQIALFCRQTSSMLKAGVSLVKAIDIMYQQSIDKKMKAQIQKIYEGVQKGDLLSETLKKQHGIYPELMISMIESGEASGTLDVVVEKLAVQFEADLKLKRKLISAVTYPGILTVLCVGVVILLVGVVMPTFSDIFEDAEDIPRLTQILLGVSSAFANYWYIFIFVIAVAIIGFNFFIRTEPGRLWWDGVKLSAPIFGPLSVRVASVRFCRTFAVLFSSGMAMMPVLEIVERVIGNAVISEDLVDVREDIRKGVTLSQAISRVPAFPPMIHSMISIGEESGSLPSILESTAEYFDDEVENAIQRMVTMIEPILLVIMGGVVGFVIASIMMAMVGMMQTI